MTGPTAAGLELLDTNIIVYAYDVDEGEKHTRAKELLLSLSRERRLVFSAQVLNEFYVAARRRAKGTPDTHERICAYLLHLAEGCAVFPLMKSTTLRALDAVKLHSLSFWDALIWASAVENGVAVVYSEDFQHGRVLNGVRFCNPFEE